MSGVFFCLGVSNVRHRFTGIFIKNFAGGQFLGKGVGLAVLSITEMLGAGGKQCSRQDGVGQPKQGGGGVVGFG